MDSCRRTQSPGKPTTRRYSPEEKAAAVRMVSTLRAELGTEHGTVHRVAQQLGYGTESVRSWVRQADIDDGHVPGVTTLEGAPGRKLEQENRELRRANEILKRAAVFLRGGARPPAQEVAAFIDANRDDVVAGRARGSSSSAACCRWPRAATTRSRAASPRHGPHAMRSSARSCGSCGRTTTGSTVPGRSGRRLGVPATTSAGTRSPG